MSWSILTTVIRATAPDAADSIIAAIADELGGARVCIPTSPRAVISDADLRRTLRENRWNVDATARALNLDRSTIYRRLQPRRAPPRPIR